MTQITQEQINQLYQKAQAGDPVAQFHLATLVVQKNPAEASTWMEKAAENGLPEALFYLGVWNTEGFLKPREMEKGLSLLEQAEQKGFEFATHYKAVIKARGFEGTPDWQGAVTDVINLAKKGVHYALSQIGFLLILKGGKHKEEGMAVLQKAASLGNPQAANFANFSGNSPAIPVADILEKAKDVLKTVPEPTNMKKKVAFEDPQVETFENLIPPEIADFLVSRALPDLKPSLAISVSDSSTDLDTDYRNCTETRFTPFRSDLVIEAVCHLIAKASGENLNQQEILGVLRYQPGQFCSAHYDYFLPNEDGVTPEVERAGQRIKTFLIYLSSDCVGGETEFPELGYKFKGKKGEGIMFANVKEDGTLNKLSSHASVPVESGEKFITTLWIRDREYNFAPLGV